MSAAEKREKAKENRCNGEGTARRRDEEKIQRENEDPLILFDQEEEDIRIV